MLEKAINATKQHFQNDPVFRDMFYNSDGTLKSIVKRETFSDLLRNISCEGIGVLYNGSIGEEIIDKVFTQYSYKYNYCYLL